MSNESSASGSARLGAVTSAALPRAVLLVALTMGLVACSSPEAAETPSLSPSAEATPTPSPSEEPTPSESPGEEPPASEEPDEPAAVGPGPVTVLDAGQGGGSGEIVLQWDGVPLAVGYRVYRAAAPGGPFAVSAEVDASSGENNLGGAFVWKPGANSYEYIEVTGDGPVYFKIVAFSEFEEGPASAVVCGGADGLC